MRREYYAKNKLLKSNSHGDPDFYHMSENDPLPEDSPSGLETLQFVPGTNRNDPICSRSSLGAHQRSITAQVPSAPGVSQSPLNYCEHDILRSSLLVKNDIDVRNAARENLVSSNPNFMNLQSHGNIINSYPSNMHLLSIWMPIDYFQQRLYSTQNPTYPILGNSVYCNPRPFHSSNSRETIQADIIRLKDRNALLNRM